MRILLTFTGFHDPYAKGLVGEEEQPGPIISLLHARSFDLVYLLSTPAVPPFPASNYKAAFKTMSMLLCRLIMTDLGSKNPSSPGSDPADPLFLGF